MMVAGTIMARMTVDSPQISANTGKVGALERVRKPAKIYSFQLRMKQSSAVALR